MISLIMPEKIYRGDSLDIDGKVDIDISNYIIRCEIFDYYGRFLKLRTPLVSGIDPQIEITDDENGEFVIHITKNTTDYFGLTSQIEIELEDINGKVVTTYSGILKFYERRINWTTN